MLCLSNRSSSSLENFSTSIRLSTIASYELIERCSSRDKGSPKPARLIRWPTRPILVGCFNKAIIPPQIYHLVDIRFSVSNEYTDNRYHIRRLMLAFSLFIGITSKSFHYRSSTCRWKSKIMTYIENSTHRVNIH